MKTTSKSDVGKGKVACGYRVVEKSAGGGDKVTPGYSGVGSTRSSSDGGVTDTHLTLQTNREVASQAGATTLYTKKMPETDPSI